MPGAGKSTVASLLHRDGFAIVTMGDVIREEAKRHNLVMKLLAVHASADMRYKHIKERGRSDVALDNNDFRIRDKRELKIGISEAIALSDEVVSNNNLTKDELRNKVLSIARKWTTEKNDKNIVDDNKN
jgi:dephospho-CoA kinase